MNKTLLSTAVAAVIGTASFGVNAALTNSTALLFDDGVPGCVVAGTYPDCLYSPTVTSGSWFSMDGNGDGVIQDGEKGAMYSGGGTASQDPAHPGNGLGMHVTTDNTGNPMGSHSGLIDGTENPVFDVWNFFGNTGMHYLTSPMNDLGVDGNGNHLIDMSGWTATWAGIQAVSVGGDSANFTSDTGIAVMTCSEASCSSSSTFTLDYTAHIPRNDPSGFGNVGYSLHLEGVVTSPVPVPAAVWLFASGLIGLIGVTKRKKA